jgi:hypothetical protein
MKIDKSIRKHDGNTVTWKRLHIPLLYFDTIEEYNKVKHKDYVDVHTWVAVDVEDMWDIQLTYEKG